MNGKKKTDPPQKRRVSDCRKTMKKSSQLSSGECVQGVKTPCAFNQTDFSNFLKVEKSGSAWRKDFFDTLRPAAEAAGLHLDSGRKEGRKYRNADSGTWTRRVCGGLFGVYVLLMIYLLFLQREPAADRGEFLRTSYNLIPFQTLRWQIQPPLHWYQIKQLGGNVVMFLPLGLMPAIWEKQRRFGVFFLTVGVSVLAVELLQWVTTLGYADIDDWILNLPGACMGYGIWWLFQKKQEPGERFFRHNGKGPLSKE